MYDVIIIGAGVSGCASARELSRYKVKACVLEKEEDVCCGTSKANSAIIHAGYDAKEGSLMARLNVLGNKKMAQLAEELDFEFQRNGSLVICRDEDDMPNLKALYDRGVANGVEDLRILNRDEVLKMEPNITDEVIAALFAPTAGIVCPFQLNIALAENAYENGVEFHFNTEVREITKSGETFKIITSTGVYEARTVVNAAGVYADKIHNMVSSKKMNITPRRGDYCLMDKNAGSHVKKTVFSLPGKYGKGVLVVPTVHGNLMVGPTAIDIDDKEGTNTTREGLSEVVEKAGQNVKNLSMRQVITSFAGLRAHEDRHEFIIEETKDCEGFVDCAGIESPGLSSCPAIGEMVADIVRKIINLEANPDFHGSRNGMRNLQTLSKEERNALIKREPAYGNIVCRCEMITEGEIMEAVNRPLGAKSMDGVKRRTRAGMGRCQSGFCSPKTMEILARELNLTMFDITKSGGSSKMIVEKSKDSL